MSQPIRILRKASSLSYALVFALLIWELPEAQAAQPDFDGAVDALISTPLDPAADASGGAGLIAASVVGGVGDIVALVDDNRYSKLVLHGVVSRTIDRTAVGLSQTATGILEAFRAEDIDRFPEASAVYLEHPKSAKRRADLRIGTFATGVGAAIPLAVADSVLNPILLIARLIGTERPADVVATWQNDSRSGLIGSVQASSGAGVGSSSGAE